MNTPFANQRLETTPVIAIDSASLRTLREAWVWILVCPLLFGIAWRLARMFYTAGAWKAHTQMPGIVPFAVTLVACIVAFFRIPWRHWWAKLSVLGVLMLSGYWLCGLVGLYYLFGLGHWAD